jgi:hypothetical protein
MIRYTAGVLLFSTLVLFFASCDILRSDYFEIDSWTPEAGYQPESGNIKVSIVFSHEPDRSSAEKAFSLTEDGVSREGTFTWAENRLTFHPSYPLEINRDYVLSVSTDACDTEGLSLDKKFELRFSTRAEGERPVLLEVSPSDLEIITHERQDMYLLFSEPVSLNACINHINLSPSQPGLWYIGDEGGTAVFSPAEPWPRNTQFKLTVSSDFYDNRGRTLGREWQSRFHTGADETKPFLLGAYMVFAGIPSKGIAAAVIPLNDLESGGLENPAWEAGGRLKLIFSKPVGVRSLSSRISAQGAPALETETGLDFAPEILFRFTEKPAFGSSFLININPGIEDEAGNASDEIRSFRIYANGTYSKPPSLLGIRLPMAPEKTEFEEQLPEVYTVSSLFDDLPITQDHYPYEEPVFTWIEVYFDTSPGASVDLFSVMDKFRFEATNNALDFSPRDIRSSGFTQPEPEPRWEYACRVEIRGYLTNTVNTGVATFQIASGLADDIGNLTGTAFRIPLVK